MKKLTKKQSLSRKSALTLGALGVVYGDIGTSPIYAFNEAVRAGGDTEAEILGVLSLVFWTLTAVVSIKYLVFVLRADNRGEGGTLAMFSQLATKIRNGKKGLLGFTVFVFLMAAAMEFSDGILTPAISSSGTQWRHHSYRTRLVQGDCSGWAGGVGFGGGGG